MGALCVLAGIAAWSTAPLATGAVTPQSSTARIEVDVPFSTSVTPGWQSGESAVRLPNLYVPGTPVDVASEGWKLSTNWANGYEMRIRSTTDPALRGLNAIDGRGAKASFADYTTAASCPCSWSGTGFDQGIFGYSVSVTSSGAAALDTAKWGTQRERKWRGFSKTSYRAYSTPGGTGQYTMSIYMRSMIPTGAVQAEGSYRAGLVVSAHPLF